MKYLAIGYFTSYRPKWHTRTTVTFSCEDEWKVIETAVKAIKDARENEPEMTWGEIFVIHEGEDGYPEIFISPQEKIQQETQDKIAQGHILYPKTKRRRKGIPEKGNTLKELEDKDVSKQQNQPLDWLTFIANGGGDDVDDSQDKPQDFYVDGVLRYSKNKRREVWYDEEGIPVYVISDTDSCGRFYDFAKHPFLKEWETCGSRFIIGRNKTDKS